ncbi:MAG TPA: YfbU family protein [Dongiaceae bacterium]|nr:YfbU family protein [Dongiaceae bacterium]
MNLSEGERLILAMLCDIHKALNLKGAVDPDALRPLILGAQDNGAACTNGTSANHRDRTAVATEVSEILDMWSAIERGYKHLSVDEKRNVEAEAGPLGRGVRFSGFDCECEVDYRDAAHHLIEVTGLFERFQGRNLDAHMPALAGYRGMLRLYAPIRSVGGDRRLDVRQIIVLANAEKYAG